MRPEATRRMCLQVLLAASACCAVSAETVRAPAEIWLRRQAEVSQPLVTVFDVVVVRAADDELIRKLRAISLGKLGTSSLRISHERLTTALSQAGVNVANVLVSGALECEVRALAPQDVEQQDVRLAASELRVPVVQGAADAPADAQLASQPQAASSLADLLRARVQAEYASQGAEVELEFEQAGREYLELTSPEYTFDIRGGRAGTGGLREFHVSVLRDGVTQRTTRIFARVMVTWPVVITRQPLSLGSYLRPHDVTIEKRRFAEGASHGFTSIEPLLGQRLKNFVEQGKMLEPADLRQDPLVQRSRPVTVISDSGGVNVRMNGVALDNGLLNDTVRVRVGPERGKRRELRGVVSGVGTVRLADD